MGRQNPVQPGRERPVSPSPLPAIPLDRDVVAGHGEDPGFDDLVLVGPRNVVCSCGSNAELSSLTTPLAELTPDTAARIGDEQVSSIKLSLEDGPRRGLLPPGLL